MALPTQTVNLSLRGGLDRKTDGRLVIPSKLTQADDVEFVDHDTVITRCGTSRVSLPAGYGEPKRLFEHSGVPTIEYESGEMLRANGSAVASGPGVYSALYEANTFARVGVITRRAQSLPTKYLSQGVGPPLYDKNFDVAVGVTNYMLAWEEASAVASTSNVRYSIRSLTTDAEVEGGLLTQAGVIFVRPRVIYDSTNARFSLFAANFVTGGTVNYNVNGYYTAEAGGGLSVAGVLVATLGGGAGVDAAVGYEALFDVQVSQGNGYAICARQSSGPGNVYMRLLDLALVPLVATTNAVPANKPVSLTAHATFSGGVLLGHAIYGAGANLRGYRLPSNTGVQSVEVTIVTVTGLVGRVAVTDDGAGGLLVALDNFTATSAIFASTYLVRCSTAHAGATSTAISTNCFLAGRTFTMRSRHYIPLVFTSAQFQSVLLVLDLTCAARNLGGTVAAQPLFVARLDWGEVSNPPGGLALNSAHRVPGCAEGLLPYLKFETNTRLAGVANATEQMIAFAKFTPLEQLGDFELNGDTYLAGALPMITDGVKVVEEGFHWSPEIVGPVTNGLVVVAPVPTGTGLIDLPGVGTYTIAFTETWLDAQGNWHESGVALLGSVTTTLGNLGINPTVIRPPSLKRAQVYIAAGSKLGLTMYRTKMSSTDTTLYLAAQGTLGSGSAVAISDADLGFGETLYTEGGILGNTPAPSCRHITSFSGHLVLTGCDDGSRVYFSKKTDKGFAAEFVSDENAFQKTVPPDAGRAVACAEMSGKLVAVCEQKIGVFYGTGPDDAGLGEYAEFDTVAKNIGALWTAPKSVLLAAEGIWFQSPYGLRLFGGQGITKGQQGRPVGSEVDDLVAGNAVTLAGGTNQQTRFALSGTQHFLVWDQVWGQFTRFTNHTNLDACLVAGDYYFIDYFAGPPSQLRRRDPVWLASDSTIDGGVPSSVPVIGDIVLGDIQFGGIQGFQRVRNMLVLSKVNHLSATPSYAIHVGYDNADPAASAEVTASPTVGTKKVVQFEHQFFTQKCETLKLQIKFYDPLGWSTVRLTDLALSVGVKRGPWKSAESK